MRKIVLILFMIYSFCSCQPLEKSITLEKTNSSKPIKVMGSLLNFDKNEKFVLFPLQLIITNKSNENLLISNIYISDKGPKIVNNKDYKRFILNNSGQLDFFRKKINIEAKKAKSIEIYYGYRVIDSLQSINFEIDTTIKGQKINNIIIKNLLENSKNESLLKKVLNIKQRDELHLSIINSGDIQFFKSIKINPF
ncbi:hypothetical protein [Aquimarina sp. I32.4]|uniref:hypothetical protein n=1 Tax=Aquimarina sp. I32.4 TaxID=2053903 RepID=UPI000CDE572F|nr:hypothetical protein [Aquimarina sp. I32.4]